MKPTKIYIDNSLLIRWFLRKFNPKKYQDEPDIIRFFSEKRGIEKYISLVSVAEFIHTLKYGEEFQKYKLTLERIIELITELQNIVGFSIIINEAINGVEIGGVIITQTIYELIDRHNHPIDCIHVDIAKRNNLCFVTYEKKIGRLKEVYDNIMTENKLIKQFE